MPRQVPRAAALLVLLLPLAGCLEDGAAGDAGLPAGPGRTPLAFLPGVPALDCGSECYEPTIAADPAGRLFVADGGTSPVAVSEDGGATWTARDPPPMPAGLSGRQSDVLLQVAPSGRLYWSALVVVQPTVLYGLQVAWSDDGARTWAGDVLLAPHTGSAEVLSPDRQWLGFAPDGTLYLTYNQLPTGIWIARSDDGGASWTGWTRAVPAESRPGGAGQSGPPVVDSQGTVHVPACSGGTGASTLVFSSTDRGATFTASTVAAACSWFPILAVAPGDALVLALQPGSAVVTHSHDGGATFVAPAAWGAGEVTAAAWPVPLGNGSLLLAWFEAAGSSSTVFVGRGTLDGGVEERALVGRTAGSVAQRTTARTDFASAALLPDGRAAVVWTEGPAAMVAVQRGA